MAKVHIPALLRAATGGQEWADADGGTVREVIESLERQYPSLAGRLTKGTAIAIDGEITTTPWTEVIGPDTEIQFLTALQGG